MKNPPFILQYPVRLNDIGVDGRMRSWVVFDLLQDAAGRHTDQLGLGLKQLRESDLSWVLSRIRVKMQEFPEYGETLKIITYPSGFDRLFAYRQFELRSAENDKLFGVAGSAWLTLDPSNFRPVSPAKYLTGLPQWEFEGEVHFQGESLGKQRAPEIPLEYPVTQRVSCAWIDYNRHLNNAYYAMLSENWLGERTGKLVRMKELQLNFNLSTAFREELCCSGVLDENGAFYIDGINTANGKNAFQAQGYCEVIGG